jgi:hypothetical protein
MAATKMAIVSVYMPHAVQERLKSLAAAQGRSMSNFITHHLAQRFGPPTRKRRAPLKDQSQTAA